MTPFFTDLVMQTDEARRAFETNERVVKIVAEGLPLERYRKLLLELYHVVWHFNPACAAAASRIGDRFRQIRYFLYDHIMEEKGHEEWIVADLEVVGAPKNAIDEIPPSTAVLALVGYNYWSADRRNACSVLGMIYALEVIASVYGGPIAAAIRDSLLLEGDQGISFITSHVSMDATHMAELRIVLNTIEEDLTRAAIIESTNVNFELFTRMLEAI